MELIPFNKKGDTEWSIKCRQCLYTMVNYFHLSKTQMRDRWNTRAPLQMKPWNWRHEGPPVGYWKKPDLVEPNYKAKINSDDAWHWAKVGRELMTRTIMYPTGPAHGYTYFDTEDDAKAACVAFVEAKRREWFEP